MKAENQVIHAKKRALERYGLTLNRKSYGEMVKLIQDGKAVHVGSRSNRSKVFYLIYEGKAYKVAYDNKRHKIVTFLKHEHLSTGKGCFGT